MPVYKCREFDSGKELLQFYAELRKKRDNLQPPPSAKVVPKPLPVVLPKRWEPVLPPKPAYQASTVSMPVGTTGRIIYETCKYFGITRDILVSKARDRTSFNRRAVAIHLINEMINGEGERRLSLTQIGRIFGQRDHTTVLHILNTMLERMRNDPVMELAVTEVRKAVLQEKKPSFESS